MKILAFLKQYLQETSRVLAVVSIMLGGLPITNAADTPPADDPAITRKLNTLKLIWSDVEANALGSDKRKDYLREFLNKSEPVLGDIPTNHPAVGGLWTMRVLAATELDDQKLAILAGQQMLKLGLDKSSNELIQKALAQLDRKGWLDPESAKAALEKEAATVELKKKEEAVAVELRQKLGKWVGAYEPNPSGLAKDGSTSGTLTISITSENKLKIVGSGSCIVEWPDTTKKKNPIGFIATHSLTVDAIVEPSENGIVTLPGDYSCAHSFQPGYWDKETHETYRVHSAKAAELYPGDNWPSKFEHQPDELLMHCYTGANSGGGYQTQMYFRWLKKK